MPAETDRGGQRERGSEWNPGKETSTRKPREATLSPVAPPPPPYRPEWASAKARALPSSSRIFRLSPPFADSETSTGRNPRDHPPQFRLEHGVARHEVLESHALADLLLHEAVPELRPRFLKRFAPRHGPGVVGRTPRRLHAPPVRLEPDNDRRGRTARQNAGRHRASQRQAQRRELIPAKHKPLPAPQPEDSLPGPHGARERAHRITIPPSARPEIISRNRARRAGFRPTAEQESRPPASSPPPLRAGGGTATPVGVVAQPPPTEGRAPDACHQGTKTQRSRQAVPWRLQSAARSLSRLHAALPASPSRHRVTLREKEAVPPACLPPSRIPRPRHRRAGSGGGPLRFGWRGCLGRCPRFRRRPARGGKNCVGA